MPLACHARIATVCSTSKKDVDEIVAACNGDLRGAVKALMLVNEQLEQRLWLVSAGVVERLPMLKSLQ